jgi:hypothetical protein
VKRIRSKPIAKDVDRGRRMSQSYDRVGFMSNLFGLTWNDFCYNDWDSSFCWSFFLSHRRHRLPHTHYRQSDISAYREDVAVVALFYS